MNNIYYNFKNNKYKNKKVIYDGIKFDSKKEANRYAELKMLEKCGAIKELQLQKKFELIPSQYEFVNGKKQCVERSCNYKADFYYYDNNLKKWCCEDTKGFKTPEYIIKRKLMLYIHNIKIVEL